VLRITESGLTALSAPAASDRDGDAVMGAQEGREWQPAGTAASRGHETPVEPAMPQPCISLRDAATALLVAWDAELERPALPTSIEALRAALGRRIGRGRAGGDPAAPRTPREGTKQQAVLSLLRGPRAPPLPRSSWRPAGRSTRSEASWLG
jgi:hypothetical protein